MGIMEDKVVIVTGAGRGVGRGVALDLARAGAAVVVDDLGVSLTGAGDETPVAEQVAREIRAFGGRAVANGESVASLQGARRIVEAALDSFGRIDGVVNNAGNLRDSLFHKMTEEDFDAVIAVHLKGSFNVSRAAAPHFRNQGSGAYVHMTLTSGLVGFWAGELFRRQARRRRLVEIDRARHGAFQRALQRGCSLRLDADDS